MPQGETDEHIAGGGGGGGKGQKDTRGGSIAEWAETPLTVNRILSAPS